MRAAAVSGRPRVPGKRQMWVIPIIVIVIGSLVTGLLLLSAAAAGWVGLLGIVASGVASVLCILLYRWLDRWEPEPPHLVIAAFLWGGGVSLVLVLLFSAATPFLAASDFTAASLQAPLVEETAKGLFLALLVISRRGRSELNSLTDTLIYAGFIGTGFSFVEDMLYIAMQPNLVEGAGLAVMRIGLGVFGHGLYTSLLAVGIWMALQAKSRAVKILAPLGGLAAAALVHGLHNGSTFGGLVAYALVQVFVMLPLLIGAALLLRWSRRRERQALQLQLPRMVHAGWLTPAEAGWIAEPKWHRTLPADPGLKAELKALREVVVELAFLRDRLDRGVTGSDLHRQHDELVALVVTRIQPVESYLHGQGPMPQRQLTPPSGPGPRNQAPGIGYGSHGPNPWGVVPPSAVPAGSPLAQYGPQRPGPFQPGPQRPGQR